MKKPCNVISITSLQTDGNPPPPQTPVAARKIPRNQLNQYTRRNFLAALLTTFSFEKAKRFAGVKEPYASRYLAEALYEGGFRGNGERFPEKGKAA